MKFDCSRLTGDLDWEPINATSFGLEYLALGPDSQMNTRGFHRDEVIFLRTLFWNDELTELID